MKVYSVTPRLVCRLLIAAALGAAAGAPAWADEALEQELTALRGRVQGHATDTDALEMAYVDLLRRYPEPAQQGRILAHASRMYCESGLNLSERAAKAVAYAEAAAGKPLDLVTALKLAIQRGDAMYMANDGSSTDYTREEIARVYLEGLRLALDAGVPADRREVSGFVVPQRDPRNSQPVDIEAERLRSHLEAERFRERQQAATGRKFLEQSIVELYAGPDPEHLLVVSSKPPKSADLDELYALALEVLGTEERALPLVERVKARGQVLLREQAAYAARQQGASQQ